MIRKRIKIRLSLRVSVIVRARVISRTIYSPTLAVSLGLDTT